MDEKQTVVAGEATKSSSVRAAQSRSVSESESHDAGQTLIQRLHTSAGNRVAGNWLQTKLRVGAPADAYEREADRVAEQVTIASDSHYDPTTKQPAIGAVIQRKCAECEEEKTIQRKCARCEQDETAIVRPKAASGTASRAPDLESRISMLRGKGEPLAPDVRSYFEPRLGTDFSSVRVHRNSEAAETTQGVNALAFTYGHDIAFASGQYSPDTATGKKLLAHELTHVVQQRGAAPVAAASAILVDSPHSNAEREARGMADSIAAVPNVAARPSVKLSTPTISKADRQVTSIGMNLGTTPRSGLQFFPTNVTDTRVGPVSAQGGLLSAGVSRLSVIVAENETIRRLARQLLPFFLTATPFTPPGAGAPLPLPIVTETQLAQALLVYNQYYLQLPNMAKWRSGLNFPLPIEIDPLTGVATLHPLLISSLATAFSPVWAPLLDSRASSTVAPPAVTLQADVTAFLASTGTVLERGINLAVRSLTNPVAESPFVREAFHQLAGGSFDVALAFMDNLVNNEISQLAAQRDGAAILAQIRTALAAPPAVSTPAQQASLTRANLMLGNVAAAVPVAPPTAARSRAPEKVVTIDTVKLDGASHDPAVDVAVANAIYTQCNVRFAHGINATASPAQTTAWLGGNTDLGASNACGFASPEERTMNTQARAAFGLNARIRAFFVASYSGTGGVAYSFPPFCATGPAAVNRNMAVIQNASGKGDLGHESVHILRDSPQHLPDPNLMGSSPLSVQLNDAQCTDIYNKS